MKLDQIRAGLEESLRNSLQAPDLRVVSLTGNRPAADEAREPWIGVKYGAPDPDDWFGVVPAVVEFRRAPKSAGERLRIAVKVNPAEGLARTLIPWIIRERGIALDRPYVDYAAAREFDHTGAREHHLMLALAPRTPELERVLPRCYGGIADAESGPHAVFLEYLDGVAHLDATGATGDWPQDAIAAMLTAAGGWHGAFHGAVDDMDDAFAAPRATTGQRIADEGLWRGLIDDARKRFPALMTEDIWRRRHRLVDRLDVWHAVKDGLPVTLVHDDFNNRNCGFRPAPVVLDWELVARDTPQRDLVELLTFVLPAIAGRREIDALVETHRRAVVEAAGHVGPGLDADSFMEAFRAELKLEAIDRVGHQFLFAAAFPLAYLARINARIERLLELYG